MAAAISLACAGLLEGRVALFLAALGTGIMFSALILVSIRVARPFAPLLSAIMLGAQTLWVMGLCITGASTLVAETTFRIDLASHPVRAMLPLLILPAGLLIGGLAVVPRRHSGDRSFIEYPVRSDVFEIRSWLAMGAFLLLLNWPAAQENSGGFGYAIRVLNLAFLFMPFFAGRVSVRDPVLLAVWGGCLATNAVIGMAAGTRFPLFAIALFGLGRAFEKGGILRLANVQKLAVLALVLLACSGIVGIVRQEIGRGGLEIVNSERFGTFIDSASRAINSKGSGGNANGTVGEAALQRMVAWSNFAVPALTPSTVPYRGVEGVGREIAAYAAVTAMEGKSRASVLNEGLYTAPATMYGFSVNETTSVEFGVLPDAWSRGGPLMVAAVALLLGVVFGLAERVLFSRPSALAFVLTIVLYGDAWTMYAEPALVVFRRLIIDLILLGTGVVVINIVLRIVYSGLRRPRRSAR